MLSMLRRGAPPDEWQSCLVAQVSCHTRGMLRNVAVAICDGVSVFELGVVCEVFGMDR